MIEDIEWTDQMAENFLEQMFDLYSVDHIGLE